MNASAAADRRIEFAPPPQPANLRAYAFAVLVHLLLIAALTWGVHWKRDADNVAVEAELWSSVPHQAAPRAVQAPPPPPAPPPRAPAPIPRPAPAPPPPPRAQVAPSVSDADIAIERQKKELEQEKLEQLQKLELAKRDLQKKLDAEKRELQKQAALEKKQQEQQAQAQQQAADRKAAEKARALADAKAKAQAQAKAEAEAQAQAKAQADAKAKAQALAKAQADKLHQQTVKNMLAMANAEGGANATGKALRSSGPSGSYGARVAAAVRPNVVFPDADTVNGNPAASFNVQLAPDGTIVGTPKLMKSSGVPAWDEAALRALEKTEKLPRDIDGTVPPALTIDLRPKR